MPKTLAVTTTRPAAYSMGQKVLAGDPMGLQTISKLQNFLYGRRRECHLSLACGADGWNLTGADNSGPSAGTLGIPITAGVTIPIQTDFFVSQEEAAGEWTFGVECWNDTTGGPANTLNVSLRLTGGVGTFTRTLVFTSADNGTENTDTFTVSAATLGAEWVFAEILVELASGGRAADIREINIEAAAFTSGLPDPEDT